jgi:hypothetical protein
LTNQNEAARARWSGCPNDLGQLFSTLFRPYLEDEIERFHRDIVEAS